MNVYNPQIIIEGPDKVGKDSLIEYIHILSNFKYCLNSRGILSQLVYNDKYNRHNCYEITYKPLIILLTADKDDQNIRCKLTNESEIDFSKDLNAFDKYSQYLSDNDFAVVWKFNTSHITLFDLAKKIIQELDLLDFNEFIIDKTNVLNSLHLYNSFYLYD